MDSLATVADLNTRNIDTSNSSLANEMLAVASTLVRGAAGSPISRETSTIQYDGWIYETYLRLIGQPIESVTAVTIEGTAVTDYKLTADGRLRRTAGWSLDSDLADVRVTQVHGLTTVPEDIVDLVCAFAGAGIAAVADGYESHSGKVAERIDDYSVQWAVGADAVSTVMEIPERTQRWLLSMFGGGTATATTRSGR